MSLPQDYQRYLLKWYMYSAPMEFWISVYSRRYIFIVAQISKCNGAQFPVPRLTPKIFPAITQKNIPVGVYKTT